MTIQLKPFQWVDHGVSPPQPIPGRPQLAAQYPADALGHRSMRTGRGGDWYRECGALPDAKRAKPKVCGLFIEVAGVTGVLAARQANDVGFPVRSGHRIDRACACLKSHKKRFRLAEPGFALPLTVDVVSPVDPTMPPSMVNWLQRTVASSTHNVQNQYVGVADDYAAFCF